MERTPDYFLPGQRVAQGTVGGLALGAGTTGVGALMDQNIAGPTPEVQAAIDAARARQEIDNREAQTAGPEIAQLAAQNRMAIDDRDAGARQAGIAQLAAQNKAAAAVRERAAPMPPARPEEFRAQPSGLARFFSGKDYQSNSRLVNEPTDGAPVNWGNSDSAADFFRADKALMARKAEEGMNRGGAANGKPDRNEAIHRALDIISHLIGHRR
jgi:hypothetical protein